MKLLLHCLSPAGCSSARPPTPHGRRSRECPDEEERLLQVPCGRQEEGRHALQGSSEEIQGQGGCAETTLIKQRHHKADDRIGRRRRKKHKAVKSSDSGGRSRNAVQ